jgi:hypothetical protein
MAEKNKNKKTTTPKKGVVKKSIVEENKLFPYDNSMDSDFKTITEEEPKSKAIELEITNPIVLEKSLPSKNNDTKEDITTSLPNSIGEQFDFKKPVYIEIHKGNIFHYFASGLITPSKYISNRAFPDMQSIQNDALLLANTCSLSDSEEMILLEIRIVESEKKLITVKNNLAFLFQPIPTSRIKNIFVKNENIRKTILGDSLVFDGGYIPETLISASFPNRLEKNKFEVSENIALDKVDYSSKVAKFDRILGLLAFLRNYNLLLSEKTESYKTLPNHFFYAIQAIDSSFGKEIIPNNIISEFYSYLFNSNCPSDKQLLKWIFERLQVLDNFNDTDTKEFETLLNKNSNDLENEKAIRQVFFSLSKNMERKGALEIVDNIKSKSALPLYLFSYLRNYANLNSIEIARRDIPSIYSSQFGEYAFALLGYFFGYKNLRNTDERISNTNPILKKLNSIPSKPPIKFQLTTEFDYLILELVYNQSFYGNISQLKLADLKIENVPSEKLSNSNFEFTDYKIKEQLLHGKLYQSVSDSFTETLLLLNKLPKDIPLLSEFGWYCYKLSIKMKPVNLNDISFSLTSIIKLIGYSKEDLIQHIETNKRKIDTDELKARISISQKSKEL